MIVPSVYALIDRVIATEGDYVDNPADRGGPTRFGITQAAARARGYTGDMRVLPREVAVGCYLEHYWQAPNIAALAAAGAPATAAELFDTGVNMGPAAAIMLLQRSLNLFEGARLKRDGVMLRGGATLTVVGQYLAHRGRDEGDLVLTALCNGLQAGRYAEIVEADPSQRIFFYGWIRNRVMAPPAP